MIEAKDEDGLFQGLTNTNPTSSEESYLSQMNKHICIILFHLELTKTLKLDKVYLEQFSKNKKNSEISLLVKKFQDEIAAE